MAPTIAGTNALTKCEDRLVTAISNSALFQAYVGAGDAATAKASIRVGEFEDTTTDVDEHVEATWASKFPIAIIGDAEGTVEFEHTSDGGPYGYLTNFLITVAIEGARPGGENEDAHQTFKNTCLAIMQEVIGYRSATTDNKFFVTRMSHSAVILLEPNVEGSANLMRMEFFLVDEPQ